MLLVKELRKRRFKVAVINFLIEHCSHVEIVPFTDLCALLAKLKKKK